MSELDYQMALVMQHRFEQEAKSTKTHQKSDEELARTLQEQFQHEVTINKPSSLMYDHKKTTSNESKSLIDPSWELVDPTPDIHILFVAFNKRFFWNKLLTVCVSWSKRMTSCAGICSYQGAGGLCSITLSEPLLKLRPRKDLVETLLHEMIHAFLFVTHNNRDRDGHGPEFHKHMYRINKETGTSISVYHSFHDEVRLYKQHWWRCDGPCQNRKPFFGWVKRAMNRAPGHYDRWFAEHTQTCGGAFIKVKEPEKVQKIKVAKKEKKLMGDIRKYIKNDSKAILTPKKQNQLNHTAQVVGFKDLDKKSKGRFNSSSTIVVNKLPSTKPIVIEDSPQKKPITVNSLYHGLPKNVHGFSTLNSSTSTSQESNYQPSIFNKDGYKRTNKSSTSNQGSTSDDFLVVRNHWQNKFTSSSTFPQKRHSSEIIAASPSKVQKLDESLCPVCNENVSNSDINAHLDLCLAKSVIFSDDEETVEEIKEPSEKEVRKCPICTNQLSDATYDLHVADCLLKVHEQLEATYLNEFGSMEDNDKNKENVDSEEKIKCLACGAEIVKNDLDAHLEECLSMSAIFDVEFELEKND